MRNWFKLPKEDRLEIINQTAFTTGLPAAAVEKDLWVMFVINAVFNSNIAKHLVFKGGTSLGVQCYNIRATREEFDNVVGSSTNSGFNGCSFHDIHANFLVERTIKANSLVNLKRSVNNTKVYNIGATSNPSQNNVNYGLLVDSLDGGIVSGALHAENLGVGYITDDISVPSTVVRTHINGVSFNNGDPNSQGVISATSSANKNTCATLGPSIIVSIPAPGNIAGGSVNPALYKLGPPLSKKASPLGVPVVVPTELV